jgi:hypothetical protein
MYIPQYFKSYELVPQMVYKKYLSRGENWLFPVLFDERLLRLIDKIRSQFGPMTINDWIFGGENQWRGFRTGTCNVGADLSQHRFGRAVDMIPKDISAKEIRKAIIADPIRYAEIGGLEMGISWLHIDVRPRNSQGQINLFYP